MELTLESYRKQRERLLAEIIAKFTADERFLAGWLTGSFGRNEEDHLSDLDLSIVVSDQHSESLCRKSAQVSAQTSPERFSLFSQFGTPALIHENNNNAREDGTFTFVLYADSPIMVDWILFPYSKATRPNDSKLLFDKVGISPSPLPQPETLEQRKKAVAEQWAFFWMMTAITTKYIIRNDGVFVAEWIEHQQSMVREIERWLKGEPWSYVRGSLNQLQTTREKQIESLKQLCQRMQELRPIVANFTGSDPLTPQAEIETLLLFANDTQSEIENRQS